MFLLYILLDHECGVKPSGTIPLSSISMHMLINNECGEIKSLQGHLQSNAHGSTHRGWVIGQGSHLVACQAHGHCLERGLEGRRRDAAVLCAGTSQLLQQLTLPPCSRTSQGKELILTVFKFCKVHCNSNTKCVTASAWIRMDAESCKQRCLV